MSQRSTHVKQKIRMNSFQIPKNQKKQTSSLIDILQSFGIIVKTSINYHDRRKRNDFEHQFLEEYMNNTYNYDPVVDESNIERISEMNEQVNIHGNLFPTSYSNVDSYVVNIKRSKIIVRFKCDLDQEAFEKRKDSDVMNCSNIKLRRNYFNSIIATKRSQRNVIHIDFDLKFDSLVEIVKYLNISNSGSDNLELENEILSRLVQILDVDHEKKQVYVKLKTFDTTDKKSKTNLSSYYLIGKIDGTDSCFILDMTYHTIDNRSITTIDRIYKFYTPKHLKGRIYNKKVQSTFHDCKEIGIYRVLIGCFFSCLTSTSGVATVLPSCRFEPTVISNNNWIVIAELFKTGYPHDYAGGRIDTGFYSVELPPSCKYNNGKRLDYRREVYHFSL